MKKDMPLEGLRWSRDSGSALYDTPQNGRSRTGWGGTFTPSFINFNFHDSCINSYIWIYRLIFFPFFYPIFTSF